MDSISDWIWTRLEADAAVSDEAQLLVVAAIEGDDLDGAPRTPHPGPVEPDPAGAFLASVQVQGFRGIGPPTTLELQPRPGLTVVAGRNGSGKSSLAEALEVALTGTTYRWLDKRSLQWQAAWRNIHEDVAPRIVVTLAEEGAGPTTITVEWESDDLRSVRRSLQRRGRKREAGLGGLGWEGPLQTFRPLLSYDELGGILAAEPSKLYDALARVLGLEQVATAIARLDRRAKELGVPGADLERRRKALRTELAQLQDDRATQATRLLASRSVDARALRRLATGVGAGPDAPSSGLHAVLALGLPSAAEVDAATDGVAAAVDAVRSAGDAAAEALELMLSVKQAALLVHAAHPDRALRCPVCEVGMLDESWAANTRAEVEHGGRSLGELRVARDRLASARQRARALVAAVPACLTSDDVGGLASADAAVRAWTAWADVPRTDLGLAEHLKLHHQPVAAALAMLQAQAREEVTARDEAWTNLAGRLAAFADDTETWAAQKPDADLAQQALRWLKTNDVTLKNERLRPIGEQTSRIWALLRQESSVDLQGLTLEGTATRRRVAITAAVDGSEAGALAVMSQGELHALALALFLPRATMPESPFRFVVLDDPVQAMDPAKVDGLVDVLAEIAESRQVVVFSHDDRLASAVRRSGRAGTILEVTRHTGSAVAVTTSLDPARRYLDDAYALLRDDGLPDATLRRTLPGLLRLAVESQAYDRFFTSRLAEGADHATIERDWSAATTTALRLSLALYGDRHPLDGWLGKYGHRKRGLGVCSSAVHQGLNGDPLLACEDVKRLVEDLREGRL